MLERITPVIITFNEAANLERVMRKLDWATEVIVVDSLSTDDTQESAKRHSNSIVIERVFDTFAAQCNFGLQKARTEWVLSMDADYILTDELLDEIAQLRTEPEVSAYFVRFRYCVAGHPLRGSLYPPRAVLFRKSRGHYVQDGHAHRLVFEGASEFLDGYLLHDDRKPLGRWLDSQQRYARQEADKLIAGNGHASSMADRLRRWIWPAAPAAFVYTLLVKGCLFDGWPGWFYAMQRTYAELLLSLELLDRRFSNAYGELCNRAELPAQMEARIPPVSEACDTLLDTIGPE